MKLLRCVCYIRPFVFATGEVLAFAPGQVLVRIRQNAGLCRAEKRPRGVMCAAEGYLVLCCNNSADATDGD